MVNLEQSRNQFFISSSRIEQMKEKREREQWELSLADRCIGDDCDERECAEDAKELNK